MLIPEKERTRVEEDGHAKLTEAELEGMARSKTTHVCLVVCAVFVGIQMVGIFSSGEWLFAWPAFTIGAIVEAFAPGMVENGQKARAVATALMSTVLSFGAVMFTL